MRHFESPYIDKIIAADIEILAFLTILEDACRECTENPESRNTAMANMCRHTHQNIQNIRQSAKMMKERRGE